MPPERGLEGIAVEVGAEHQHAGLAAPVPFVLPITRALLIAGTTPRPRFGDFPAGREDGVALLRGDFGIGGFAVAWPEEERQPRRADNLTGPLVRAGKLRVGGIVPPSLEPQCRAVAYIDPVADGGMRAHVAKTACARAVVVYGRIAAQDVEALLGAEVQHQAPRSEPHRKIRPPGLGTGSLVQAVALDPQPVRDPEADPASAPDLVVELEGAIEARVRSEPAELELELVLGVECGGPAHQQHREDRDYPHGTTPWG